MLIGGTIAIIIAEIAFGVIKKKTKINNAIRNSNEILENEYDEVAYDIENAVQDNSNTMETLEQNDVTGNKWQDIGFNHGNNTAYNTYNSTIINDDNIILNKYNRNINYNHYDDIK